MTNKILANIFVPIATLILPVFVVAFLKMFTIAVLGVQWDQASVITAVFIAYFGAIFGAIMLLGQVNSK